MSGGLDVESRVAMSSLYRFGLFAIGTLLCAAGCANLLGTDFSGNPRDPDAGDDATSAANDGAGAGNGGGAGDEDHRDGGTAATGDGGGAGDGALSDASAEAAPPVYCGREDASTECVCTNTPSKGLTLGEACNGASVSSPSLCCAFEGWPAPSIPPGYAGCVCSSIFCEVDVFGDVCQCGFAAPDNGDKPVASCTGWAKCCRGKNTYAPVCACYKQSIPCQSDEEEVPSCAPSSLQCEYLTPSACN
jgi:hypothetical protein